MKRLWSRRSKRWNELSSQTGVWRRTALTNRVNSEDWRSTLCLNLEMPGVKTPAEEEGKRWHLEWGLAHSEGLRLSWEEQGLLSREWPVCKRKKEGEKDRKRTRLLGIFLWTRRIDWRELDAGEWGRDTGRVWAWTWEGVSPAVLPVTGCGPGRSPGSWVHVCSARS